MVKKTLETHRASHLIHLPEPVLNGLIGKRIFLLREKAGINVKTMSAALKISEQQYRKYERGMNGLNAAKIYIIAHILSLSPDEFFSDCMGWVPSAQDHYLSKWPESASPGEVKLLIEAYQALPSREQRYSFFSQIWSAAGLPGGQIAPNIQFVS